MLDCNYGFAAVLFWFIIFTFVAYIILFSLRPTWILKAPGLNPADNDSINYQTLLIDSVVIGIIIAVICYLIMRC